MSILIKFSIKFILFEWPIKNNMYYTHYHSVVHIVFDWSKLDVIWLLWKHVSWHPIIAARCIAYIQRYRKERLIQLIDKFHMASVIVFFRKKFINNDQLFLHAHINTTHFDHSYTCDCCKSVVLDWWILCWGKQYN